MQDGILFGYDDEGPDEDDWREAVAELDADGDGQLGADEVADIFDNDGDGKLDAMELQEVFDTDGDGKIDASEVGQMFDMDGDGVLDENELAAAMDTDGDGEVSAAELAAMMKSRAKPAQKKPDVPRVGRFSVQAVVAALVEVERKGGLRDNGVRVFRKKDRIYMNLRKSADGTIVSPHQALNVAPPGTSRDHARPSYLPSCPLLTY